MKVKLYGRKGLWVKGTPTCSNCKGVGYFHRGSYAERCDTCMGFGIVTVYRRVFNGRKKRKVDND